MKDAIHKLIHMLQHEQQQLPETLEKLSEAPHFVSSRIENDRIIFHYKQYEDNREDNISRVCRGLILHKDTFEVLSLPFTRFFNLHEFPSEDTLFDFESGFIMEKLDGTLIQIYHDHHKWCIGTRRTAFADKNTDKDTYAEIVTRMFNAKNDSELQEKLTHLDKAYTFLFELVGPENRVITDYAKNDLVLLAARHKCTGDYVDIETLHGEIYNLLPKGNIRLPQIYHFTKLEDIIKYIASLETKKDIPEGVVCVSKNQRHRIKIKNPKYLRFHKYINVMDDSNMIEFILANDHHEIISVFPRIKAKMLELEDSVNKFIGYIQFQVDIHKHIEDNKEYALAIQHLTIKHILFTIRHKGVGVKDVLVKMNIKAFMQLYDDFRIG